jgi:putative ABC transport system permease protein
MFRNYVAAALRNLSRNRLYAGVTIAGLAIGFAAAMLVALFVRDEFSYDRFIPHYQRVYRISSTISANGGEPTEGEFTPIPLAALLRLDFPQMELVGRFAAAGYPPQVKHGEISASEQSVAFADPEFFQIAPVPTLAGDLAHALDAPDSVVIDRTMARKYFSADAPIGQVLLIDKHPMRVTAVIQDLPSNTHLVGEIFPSGRAPWGVMHDPAFNTMGSNRVQTYFRLSPGVPISAISSQFPAFVDRRYDLTPRTGDVFQSSNTKVWLTAVNIADIHLRPAQSTHFTKQAGDPKVVMAIAAVGVLIVAVAAINFVTLMTARAARRAVEVGVRKSAGASRRDLIIQFMGEALIYVVMAGIVGMAMAELLLPAFNALVQRRIGFDYLHDPALAAGILGVVLAVALLAGAYPALVLSGFRPAAVLKGGIIKSAGGAGVRQVLVIFQFAVLIVLILVAGTIYRQTIFSLNDATHLDKSNTLLLLAKPCTDGLRDQIRKIPGVTEAACASAYALNAADNEDTMSVGSIHKSVTVNPIDYRFLETYRLKPVAGRFFDPNRPGDAAYGLGFHQPIVINETAARALGFANPADAVGKSVYWHGLIDLAIPEAQRPQYGQNGPSTVIGVSPDFTFGSARSKIPAAAYAINPKQGVEFSSLALNVRLDPARKAEALAAIDQAWKRLGDGPVTRYFVDVFMLRLYVDTIVQGAMITASALIALSIACLGLFALSAYTTERRTKEIGIRKAMGASSADILKLLLWQFTQPVLWANLIALPAAWLVMDWWLKGFAYRVSLAPWTFGAAAASAVVIAWATVFVHALRVSRARPVGALRYE